MPVVLLGVISPAVAHTPANGGTAAPEPPEVAAMSCGDADACAVGQVLRVRGENLRAARTVVFLGGPGRGDDRRVRPAAATPHRVRVRVPAGARSGRLKVLARGVGAAISRERVRVTAAAQPQTAPPQASPAEDGGVFPVKGRYDFGTETNRFGGGRNHKGQDVFATCGTPVVAALSGTVTLAKWHDNAGNYTVIKAADGTSQAYMHLLKPATVARGDQVTAGQQLGQVGETGRASGCHLHFELWTAPGWYEGGEAIDPLPSLRRWAAAS